MPGSIQLIQLLDSHKDCLLQYDLPATQMRFTALPEKVFERLTIRNNKGDFEAFPITILYDDVPVGMFVLDKGSDLLSWTDNTNAIFLRSLSINPQFQNKGVAKQAMQQLPQFIAQAFPQFHINEIVLGVNLQNEVAKRLYNQLGFVERGYNMNPPFVGQLIMKWYL